MRGGLRVVGAGRCGVDQSHGRYAQFGRGTSDVADQDCNEARERYTRCVGATACIASQLERLLDLHRVRSHARPVTSERESERLGDGAIGRHGRRHGRRHHAGAAQRARGTAATAPVERRHLSQ